MSTVEANSQAENPKDKIVAVIYDVEAAMEKFKAAEPNDSTLTTAEKRRLVGAGVRNYGFIEKAEDIARDNPDFHPPNFSYTAMHAAALELEEIRQLVLTLEQFLQLANDCLLMKGDAYYRYALRIYGSLREQARNKVPGADPLFKAFLKYFRRPKISEEGEETEKELERDFHRLIHGKADGEIKIVNERPHASGGVHEVVDDVHKGKASFKESEEGEIRE
jgi:hypothetical protein